MIYLFGEAEYFLFQGAINFGDLILMTDYVTEQQKSEVKAFQSFLRTLPCGTNNLEGGYSVSIHSYDANFVGINRSFSVWLDQRDGLGIQSFYTILPDRDEEKEREQENRFVFRWNERPSGSWNEYRRWVHGANNFLAFHEEGQELEVETSFRIINPHAKKITIQSDGEDYLWSDEGLVDIEEIAEGFPPELHQDFIAWSISLNKRWPNFDDDFWCNFHKRGIRLGKILKNYLKKGITLVYRRGADDYDYREQEYFEI